MDSKRAQEIMNSPVMINVKYHGIPVYIKDVNERNAMATVFPLDEMDNEQEVELRGLMEDQLIQ
jgi:small acid-soluble spore protein H (minor)